MLDDDNDIDNENVDFNPNGWGQGQEDMMPGEL